MSDNPVFQRGVPDGYTPPVRQALAPFDFFLDKVPPNNEGQTVFTSDVEVFLYEHRVQYKRRGEVPAELSKLMFTCPGKSQCPLCMNPALFSYYPAALATLLDVTPYTKDNGSVVPATKKMVRFKGDMAAMIKTLRTTYGGSLRGWYAKPKRTGGMAPNCGDLWPFIQQFHDLPAMVATLKTKYPNWEPPEDLLEPIDIQATRAPLPIEHLQVVAQGQLPPGQGGGSGAAPAAAPPPTESFDFTSLGGTPAAAPPPAQPAQSAPGVDAPAAPVTPPAAPAGGAPGTTFDPGELPF